MFKKKPIFVTFEGIEGSGKSYQCKKLYENLKKRGINAILTREPGGSPSAEKIRKLILTGTKDKFSKTTDTLLYLAARNEHLEKKIIPCLKKKKIVICDRFTDSTLAYQVYGSGVSKSLIDNVHKNILGNLKPNITFILKVNQKKAHKRLKKRKHMNRYDKFSKEFYKKVQSAFIKKAKTNNKLYLVIENSNNTNTTEKFILNQFLKILKK